MCGEPQRYAARRTMGGQTRTIDVMFVLVPGQTDSGDRFIITTARDITDRGQIEAQRRRVPRQAGLMGLPKRGLIGAIGTQAEGIGTPCLD